MYKEEINGKHQQGIGFYNYILVSFHKKKKKQFNFILFCVLKSNPTTGFIHYIITKNLNNHRLI